MMDDRCKRLMLDGGPWDLMANALLPAKSTPWHMGCSLIVLPRNSQAAKPFSEVKGANDRCMMHTV